MFFTNLVFKSFNPLMHGSPRALATLLARNLLLAILVIDAARRLARAPIVTETDPAGADAEAVSHALSSSRATTR